MNSGGTRLLMDDVAFVENDDIDASSAEDEADDKPHRAAAGDDDPAAFGHAGLALGGDLFVAWLHFLDGAAPAGMGEVENNPVGILVFHLIESIRIVILTAHKVGAARLLDLLGGLVEIVDPHAEVDESVLGLAGRHPGEVAGKLQ